MLRWRVLITPEATALHQYCWTNFPFRVVDWRAVFHILGAPPMRHPCTTHALTHGSTRRETPRPPHLPSPRESRALPSWHRAGNAVLAQRVSPTPLRWAAQLPPLPLSEVLPPAHNPPMAPPPPWCTPPHGTPTDRPLPLSLSQSHILNRSNAALTS